jgi:hypothetical protein
MEKGWRKKKNKKKNKKKKQRQVVSRTASFGGVGSEKGKPRFFPTFSSNHQQECRDLYSTFIGTRKDIEPNSR